MAGTINLGDPTGLLVKNMVHNGTGYGTITATGTLFAGLMTVRVPVAASTTGNFWSNPELGTVFAQAHMVWVTAGTGTFDMGVSSDGTSGQNNIVDGGTMLAGVAYGYGSVAATLVTGIRDGWRLVGPAGTGTNNSITVIHDETVTSTAAGFLIVNYVRIG